MSPSPRRARAAVSPGVARRSSPLLAGATLLAGLALAACGGAAPAAQGPGSGAAAPADALAGLLSPDGTRFAAERTYQGECAPPGSRGGCHTITLAPDGTYRNVLFDAVMSGTYVIAGRTVRLTAADPAMNEELALSADGAKLGDMTLQP